MMTIEIQTREIDLNFVTEIELAWTLISLSEQFYKKYGRELGDIQIP
jgi:hypothetical protein